MSRDQPDFWNTIEWCPMRMAWLLIVAGIGWHASGCNQPSPSVAPPVQGYEFEVRAPDGGTTTGQGATFVVQSGGRSVEMKKGTLSINGKSFGAVEDGAQISVDETGKMFVNGVERLPAAGD